MISKKAKRKRELEEQGSGQPVKKLCTKPFSKRDKELSWSQRAVVIFFFLHRLLGNKNMALTCEALLRKSAATIRSWLCKRDRNKWVPLVERLTVRQVVNGIPNPNQKWHFQCQLPMIEVIETKRSFKIDKKYSLATGKGQQTIRRSQADREPKDSDRLVPAGREWCCSRPKENV